MEFNEEENRKLILKLIEEFEKDTGFLLPEDYKKYVLELASEARWSCKIRTIDDDEDFDGVEAILYGFKYTLDLYKCNNWDLSKGYYDKYGKLTDGYYSYDNHYEETKLDKCFIEIGQTWGSYPIYISLDKKYGYGAVYFQDEGSDNLEPGEYDPENNYYQMAYSEYMDKWFDSIKELEKNIVEY